MHHLWHDVRYSLRSLARVPLLSITIVLTVGIGLGVTAAMIAVTRAVLIAPLPYAGADSLAWVYTDNAPYRFSLSVVDYRALEADHPAFSAVAAYQTRQVTVTDGSALAERVRAKSVTGSYFPLLGQRPHIGRLFDTSDDGGGDRLAVLTHAYWLRRFGGDPLAVGRGITIDGVGHSIVGVLQPTTGPLEHDVAAFTAERWPRPTRKGPFFTTVIGRLRPGVSREAAVAALRATNARLFPIWRSSYQDEKATWGMLDLKTRVVGDVGTRIRFVLAAVACLLLIACANALNLLVARSLQRRRELAIRGALGASRGRLLQHVLIEAGALTAGAALVGACIAAGSLRAVAAYGEGYLPRIGEIGFSGPMVLWLAALSLVSGLVMGVVPAFHGACTDVDEALRAGGRSSTDGRAARRIRRALVAAEFALATPLLVAAVLVLASLDRLGRVPIGMDTTGVLTAAISLNGPAYSTDSARALFWKRVLDRVRALPGVSSAAIADSRPPAEAGQRNNFDLEDHPTPPGQNQPISTWVGISPEFFRTAGLSLERGRPLDDRSLAEDVVVVDRAWANRFFPGAEVLGRRFRNGGCTTCPWTTVVGVVANVKWMGLEAVEDGTVYFPFVDMSTGFVVLRTNGDPSVLSMPLQRAIQELDPSLAVSDMATGQELVSEALATARYVSVLIAMFASTALVLAVIGIFGVVAFFVQQHARDIGIRLALGGTPARVRRMVVVQGMRLVLAGVVVGVGAAAAASRFMSALVFGVSATDPRMLAGVPALLVAIAFVACLAPAQRAATLDPAEVLRQSA